MDVVHWTGKVYGDLYGKDAIAGPFRGFWQMFGSSSYQVTFVQVQ